MSTTAEAILDELLREYEGRLPVERFMKEALHHPEVGYYSRNVRTIGLSGDFSTAATLHPALGGAIARWLLSWRAKVRSGRRWHIVEIGAGTGALAASVVASLGLGGRLGLTYHVVESSPSLEARQRQALASSRFVWHRDIREALDAASGRALLFSNELVDAFPFAVLRLTDGVWRTLCLERRDGDLELVAGEEATDKDSSALPPGHGYYDGQQVEASFAYRDWLRAWAPHWKAGAMLTIDYGDISPDIYRGRWNGTLRAYLRQERLHGSSTWRNFGRQDLTADVNFTDLMRWSEELGISTVRLDTQSEFLLRLVPALAIRARFDRRIAFLLDRWGAGSAYRVLEQSRESPESDTA
jgi:SAM-dependent MidA family methyltransferase